MVEQRYLQRPTVSLASLALLLLVCSVSVDTQSFFIKKCPKQSVVKNLDVKRYLGTWYENRKYFAIFQAGGRCVSAVYTDQGNGLIGVENKMINFLGKPQSIKGQAKKADPSRTEAKLSVSFTSETAYQGREAEVTDVNYQVLDTDYDSYAVVWNCSPVKFLFNKQFLWILTRARNPPASVLETALGIISRRKLNSDRLEITNQTNCPA